MSILDQFKLDGRVAIVTGASRGLGQALAIGLAEAGARIAAVASGDCTETCERIRAAGGQAQAIRVDLSGGATAAESVITQTEAAFGAPGILVNNAGIIRRKPFLEASAKDWDDVMALNIDAVYHLSQQAARRMVAAGQGGRIISIASMLTFQGGINVPAYAASKSAIAGLTRAMACELAPHGITANAVAPGYFATDNTELLRQDAARNSAILARIPAGRWGEPADLVGMVVFLASPAAAYCTGFVHAVDGGWLAR